MSEPTLTGQSETTSLLLIERDEASANGLAASLREQLMTGASVTGVRCGRDGVEALRGGPFDIVLADLHSLSDLSMRTEEAVGRIARLASGALLIVFLDATSVSAAMGIMRAGAHDCVAKPVSGEALALKIGALALRMGRPRALGIEAQDAPQAETAMQEPLTMPAVLPMWRQEQKIIEDAIRSFAGNIALAAAALELSPSTIYRKRQAWADQGKRSVA
jgi:DNA-binding NtrC family response regulator